MTWTLIIFIWAGAWTKGNDATLLRVPDFENEAECEAAGRRTNALVKETQQEVRYLCIAQSRTGAQKEKK